MKPHSLVFTRLTTLLLSVAGCVYLSGCRADPAPDAGFVTDPSLMTKEDDLPFDAVWLKPGVDLRGFKSVYIAPIDTTHLLKQDWWDKVNFAPGDQQKEAQILANYFHERLTDAFQADDRKVYQVVDQPQHDSLIIELAIVEVVPTKIWLNIIGYAALGGLSEGTTAFEGRLRDGKNQELIGEMKDREFGQMSLVNISDFSWCRHSEHTIKIWSSDLVKMCYRTPGKAISSMATFTLRPW
jgi:hypothetical protein